MTTCPTCGTKIRWDDLWPTWHGVPSTAVSENAEWSSAPSPEVTADFIALPLDPALVDVPISRPGHRGASVLLVGSIVAWILVTLMYERGNPAAYWDFVWFALAILTIGLGLWLGVLLVRRARTHGFGPALRWLVS